jgi:hypothetical protein
MQTPALSPPPAKNNGRGKGMKKVVRWMKPQKSVMWEKPDIKENTLLCLYATSRKGD